MSIFHYNPICQNFGTQKISNINEYVQVISEDNHSSAIDEFYTSRRRILNIASNPSTVDSNRELGNLLFLGLISITENYFRDILTNILHLCPVSQSCSSSQSISLGSVIWHDGYRVEKGSFENISLADAEAVKKTIHKYLNIQLSKSAETIAALEEYEKICQLRHAVVHSNSYLSGKNALTLGLESTGKKISVSIGYKELQETAAICTSLVTSINLELFKVMVERWAIHWPHKPRWTPQKDNSLFNDVWDMFYSKFDSANNTISDQLTMRKYRNDVKKYFNR